MSVEAYNPDAEQQSEKVKTPEKELDFRADAQGKKSDVQRLYTGLVERFPGAKGSLDAKKQNCLDRLTDRVSEAEDKIQEAAADAYDKVLGIFE